MIGSPFSTAGFKQMENALTVHLQHGGGREKIWSQGERSRGIWIATQVTFQTSKPAEVRVEGGGTKHVAERRVSKMYR